MRILKYITIESNETFEQALSKLRREVRESSFVVNESPYKMGGNHKVLKLLSRDNFQDFIKIDGPGFIIDELFAYFINK